MITVGIISKFSAIETRYECNGEISNQENKQPATIYIKLGQYRWWVGLWSDSDGDLKLEIPNTIYEYYSHINEVGDQLQIYQEPGKMSGHFSSLSKFLGLKTSFGFFDGTCKAIS